MITRKGEIRDPEFIKAGACGPCAPTPLIGADGSVRAVLSPCNTICGAELHRASSQRTRHVGSHERPTSPSSATRRSSDGKVPRRNRMSSSSGHKVPTEPPRAHKERARARAVDSHNASSFCTLVMCTRLQTEATLNQVVPAAERACGRSSGDPASLQWTCGDTCHTAATFAVRFQHTRGSRVLN